MLEPGSGLPARPNGAGFPSPHRVPGGTLGAATGVPHPVEPRDDVKGDDTRYDACPRAVRFAGAGRVSASPPQPFGADMATAADSRSAARRSPPERAIAVSLAAIAASTLATASSRGR